MGCNTATRNIQKSVMELDEQKKYLKAVKLALENIVHKSESDSAYFECSKIAEDLYQKFPTNDFGLDKSLLKDYPFKGSGKRKTEIIKEFTKDTLYDLQILIGSLERRNS
jgi:hypothetical protein